MNLIKKALWPTAIGAASLMLFGALGGAVNANEVTDDGVQTKKGGVVYVEVDVTSASGLPADHADAVAAVTAADVLVTAATGATSPVRADIVAAAKALRAAADKVGDVIDDLSAPIAAFNAIEDNSDNLITAIPPQADNLAVAIPSISVDLEGDDGASAALATAGDNVRTATGLMTTAFNRLSFPDFAPQAYTVKIKDGSGSASIVATLKDDDDEADVDSNRGTESRTVTPVLIDTKADREELKDYGVTESGNAYYVLVVVECNEFGSYDISFTNGADVAKAELECVTDVDSAVISASAYTIFTTTDKLTSEITVTLTDEDGDAAAPGDTVRFKTDNCEFADEATSKTTKDKDSTTVKGVTTAVVTLDCSEKSAKVGTATVSASVDRAADSDVYAEDLVVTLVGKATALTLTVTTSMDDMVCGQVRQIDIIAVDTNGATVANGTDVIVSTNFGGVLSGATTGRFAPSSTMVETAAGGAATVYLITSDTQVGDYTVVAVAEDATDHLTVGCGMMADADADADADAPSITPPNTGDAGLAETSGSSWMLLAIAGALASVMVAVGKGMPLFFRRS